MDPSLQQSLQRLSRKARARPWVIELSPRHASGAEARLLTVVAPADRGREVLLRAHNAVLLLQPASLRVRAPRGAEPPSLLEDLRAIHQLPIAWGEEPMPTMSSGVVDLPAIEQPAPRMRMSGLAVGLDIGGTGMKACALRDGQVVARAHGRTWPEGESGIESLLWRARELVHQVSRGEPIQSLGIGFASPMGLGGEVVALSTVMREKLGDLQVLRRFPARVAEGLVSGPVACYNDLANLGRKLSGQGRRRLLRLQIGTSFGGCWVDADGTVNAVELGRLVVDPSPQARPHTYLPLRGAMKCYLSGYGVGLTLGGLLGESVSAWESGYRLAEALRSGDSHGRATADWIARMLVGAIDEARAVLPGLREVEVGGSMLQAHTGRIVRNQVRALLHAGESAPSFAIAQDPGFDGAFAAAMAPLVDAPLRGMRRLVG
jgi:predicted NBD/HSP70 family sugar kinase